MIGRAARLSLCTAALLVAIPGRPARGDTERAAADPGAPRWAITVEAASTVDRARTADRHGAVELRGAGLGLSVALARRLHRSQWYAQGVIGLRLTGNLTRSAGDDMALPDASLLMGATGAGLTWRSRSRWWLGATLGPMMAAYVSPRALGLTALGISAEVTATRSFHLARAWSVEVAGRGSLGALPDGAQRWTFASLGVAASVRAAW